MNSHRNPLARGFAKGRGSNPWPITNALHNLHELVKQAVLLEGHLNDAARQCPDCILKHMHTMEGLIEEALGLQGGEAIAAVGIDSGTVGQWVDAYLGGTSPAEIASAVRLMRKQVMPTLVRERSALVRGLSPRRLEGLDGDCTNGSCGTDNARMPVGEIDPIVSRAAGRGTRSMPVNEVDPVGLSPYDLDRMPVNEVDPVGITDPLAHASALLRGQ